MRSYRLYLQEAQRTRQTKMGGDDTDFAAHRAKWQDDAAAQRTRPRCDITLTLQEIGRSGIKEDKTKMEENQTNVADIGRSNRTIQ